MNYLDNAATTKPSKRVAEVVNEIISQNYGNPSSLHGLGAQAEKILTNARKSIATNFRCRPDEIYFTSGATESNSIAIQGACRANHRSGNKIITTTIEHPSVLMTIKHLEKNGFEVIYVSPNSDGVITVEDVCKNVDERTILVSVMQVNNETGLCLPVEQIAKAVKQKNSKTIVHVDGVQGFTKINTYLSSSHRGIDLYSFSGHKIHALKGVGGLYIKSKTKISPIVFGGEQEKGIRVGTQNTLGIATLGEATEEAFANQKNRLMHYCLLANHLKDRLREIGGIRINSLENPQSVDYIINFSVLGIRSEILLHYLEKHKIYVSSGSACSSRSKNSSILTAFGLLQEIVDSAIRVSFSESTTVEQIDELVDTIILARNRFIKK